MLLTFCFFTKVETNLKNERTSNLIKNPKKKKKKTLELKKLMMFDVGLEEKKSHINNVSFFSESEHYLLSNNCDYLRSRTNSH
jgi:hypothetical protein